MLSDSQRRAGLDLHLRQGRPLVGHREHDRGEVARTGDGRQTRADVEMDHEDRGQQVVVEPVQVVGGAAEDGGGWLPFTGGGAYDGPQLTHQGGGLDVVPCTSPTTRTSPSCTAMASNQSPPTWTPGSPVR